jgi:hypothetical protein
VLDPARAVRGRGPGRAGARRARDDRGAGRVRRRRERAAALAGRRWRPSGTRGEVRVARFDVDQLVDYRSRRPAAAVRVRPLGGLRRPPELDVVALSDTGDTQYLLLAGPGAGHAVGAVRRRGRAAGASSLGDPAGHQRCRAIPMAVPHTRPIGVTAHGTRPELVEGHEAVVRDGRGPGQRRSALLEFRLGRGRAGRRGLMRCTCRTTSPRSAYPQAARVLLDHVGAGGGALPADRVAVPVPPSSAEAEIAEQVAGVGGGRAGRARRWRSQYDHGRRGPGVRRPAGRAGACPASCPAATSWRRSWRSFLAGGGDDKPGGKSGDEPPHEPPAPPLPPAT